MQTRSELHNRLRELHLRPIGNPGDGNCFFDAMVQALRAHRPGDNMSHVSLRQQVATWIATHPEATPGHRLMQQWEGTYNVSGNGVHAGPESIVGVATVLGTPVRVLIVNPRTFGEWTVAPVGDAPIDHEPLTIIHLNGNHFEAAIPDDHDGQGLPRKF